LSTEDVDAEKLFAQDVRKTTLLPAKTAANAHLKNLMPEDVHYSSKDLLRLFLKPLIKVCSPLYGPSFTLNLDEPYLSYARSKRHRQWLQAMLVTGMKQWTICIRTAWILTTLPSVLSLIFNQTF
jgi:hypothetical protein